jgi:WD40 repeat protein
VYDLRTATKWRILDGSEGAISAIAFEKDGERMASYSASEKSVRLWATRSPGIFGGLLTIRGTFLFMIPLEPLTGTTNEMSILRECRLEWISPNEIKLKRESGGQTIVLKVTS